jgi:PPOX class probable F420-dependent enzyme
MPLPKDVVGFLSEPNHAVIATLGSDGSPHSVATWYDWIDGLVLVNMDRTRKRVRHLQRDQRVSLTVLDPDDWYSHVSLLGEVIEMRDDPDLSDIDRLSRRYRGAPYANRARDSVSALIRPTRWHTWGPRFAG